jgi:hypothetical protein
MVWDSRGRNYRGSPAPHAAMCVVFVTRAVGSKICADREKKSCTRSFGSPTFDAAGVARILTIFVAAATRIVKCAWRRIFFLCFPNFQ